MPYRKDVFGRDGYYHVFNRGANKQAIFASEENYRYLLQLVNKYGSLKNIGVVCFCLMPNHYHFLLHQQANHSISEFIDVVFNAYVQAFNKRQQRTGTLFEGRFKHVLINKPGYFAHLIRYIHLNPVSANIVNNPEEWEFSDYRYWAGITSPQADNVQSNLTDIERYLYLTDFQSQKEYKEFVSEYMKFQREDLEFKKYLLDEQPSRRV